MLKNARIIAKNVHDVSAHLAVLRQPVPSGSELEPGFAVERAQKEAELAAAIKPAVESALHAPLMAFFIQPSEALA
jgi:hypothetical protein